MKGFYLKLQNNRQKVWVMPYREMRTALLLYQPSSLKGKLLKALLPLAPGSVKKRVGTPVSLEEYLPEKVRQELAKIWPGEVNISAFLGTPGTHCKPTLQVSRGRQVLGYLKYTVHPSIAELFFHEADILLWLQTMGVSHVPHCLACAKWGERLWGFAQDTEKKAYSKMRHTFGAEHRAFLAALFDKTKQRLPFAQTDYARTLCALEDQINELPACARQRTLDAIGQVRRHYEKKDRVEFAVCHRDFTPWNTCVVQGALYVFDWEYARKTYPPGLDEAHFFVQTQQLEHHRSEKELFDRYRKKSRSPFSLKCYLLDSMALYLQRGEPEDRKIAEGRWRLLEMVMNVE